MTAATATATPARWTANRRIGATAIEAASRISARNGSTIPSTSTSWTQRRGVIVIWLPRIAVLTSVSSFGTDFPSVGASASSALAATTVASVRFRKSVFGERLASFAPMLRTASANAAFAGGVPSAETTTDSIKGRALTSSPLPPSTIPSTIGCAIASRVRSSASVLFDRSARLSGLKISWRA